MKYSLPNLLIETETTEDIHEFKVLDVGCGDKPKGDVNCDLYTGMSPHFADETHKQIVGKKIPNFVKCAADFLPFRNNIFLIVRSHHLLEHCKHPFNVLREFHRVTSEKVLVEVPRLRQVTFGEPPSHLYTWSEYSLKNLLQEFSPT